MSNLIKASMIRYDENLKTIDQNAKADSFRQIYVNQVQGGGFTGLRPQTVTINNNDSATTGTGEEFEPGIFGEHVIVRGSDEDTLTEQQQKILDNQIEIAALEEKLEDLKNEAASILDKAEEDASEIMERAQTEAEDSKAEIIEQFKNDGYKAGMDKAAAEINKLKAELSNKIKETEENYDKQVREIEPAFVEILMKYVEKLTGIYAEEDREVILHLIDSAITNQPSGKQFIIHVAETDYETVVNAKSEILEKLPKTAELEIIADKLMSAGECTIETETRVFDCGIGAQLEGLIKELKLLSASERI